MFGWSAFNSYWEKFCRVFFPLKNYSLGLPIRGKKCSQKILDLTLPFPHMLKWCCSHTPLLSFPTLSPSPPLPTLSPSPSPFQFKIVQSNCVNVRCKIFSYQRQGRCKNSFNHKSLMRAVKIFLLLLFYQS